MRTTLVSSLMIGSLLWSGAAVGQGLIDVKDSGSCSATVAVCRSGTSEGTVAVTGFGPERGNASRGTIAVAGTGNTTGTVAATGWGNSTGAVASAVSGDAAADALAVTAVGRADSPVTAVAGFGWAEGGVVAAVGRGVANGGSCHPTPQVPVVPDVCFGAAFAVLGAATAAPFTRCWVGAPPICQDELHLGVAVSVTGHAEAHTVAGTYSGSAGSAIVTFEVCRSFVPSGIIRNVACLQL